MTAPAALACPFCATVYGHPGRARRRQSNGLNPRYSCAICGCRYTLDQSYLDAAVSRMLPDEAAKLQLDGPPDRVNGVAVHPDGHYFD